MHHHSNITITNPTLADFETIKTRITEFELDDRELECSQFLVAKINDEVVGFGRIRHYINCSELCSLGVLENERLKGVGKTLVSALTKEVPKPLYLVCIIPVFFERLGFEVTQTFPLEIKDKLNYCTQTLVVKETYAAMRFKH